MTKYKPPRTHLFLKMVPANANPSSEAQRRVEEALRKLARLIGRRIAREEIAMRTAEKANGETNGETEP
jgi:hypothetical protein